MDEYQRFQYDTSVQKFKAWLEQRLRRNQRDAIDNLAKRLLKDTRIPRTGSLGGYRGYIRVYYRDDSETFELAWQEMRTEPLTASWQQQEGE